MQHTFQRHTQVYILVHCIVLEHPLIRECVYNTTTVLLASVVHDSHGLHWVDTRDKGNIKHVSVRWCEPPYLVHCSNVENMG